MNSNSPTYNPKIRQTYNQPAAQSIIPATKLDIYADFAKLVRQVKKQIIKEISSELEKRPGNAENYHPYLFTVNFWDMSYDIYVSHDNFEKLGVNDYQATPFEKLIEYYPDQLQVYKSNL